MLRFDLLGFEAQFWFNFVSHSDGKLTEVQFWNEKPKARNRTYRKAAAALKTSMGKPNVVDMSRWGQQTWRFGDLKVSNYISKWRQPREGRKGIAHTLSFSINHEAWQERSPSLANSSE